MPGPIPAHDADTTARTEAARRFLAAWSADAPAGAVLAFTAYIPSSVGDGWTLGPGRQFEPAKVAEAAHWCVKADQQGWQVWVQAALPVLGFRADGDAVPALGFPPLEDPVPDPGGIGNMTGDPAFRDDEVLLGLVPVVPAALPDPNQPLAGLPAGVEPWIVVEAGGRMAFHLRFAHSVVVSEEPARSRCRAIWRTLAWHLGVEAPSSTTFFLSLCRGMPVPGTHLRQDLGGGAAPLVRVTMWDGAPAYTLEELEAALGIPSPAAGGGDPFGGAFG